MISDFPDIQTEIKKAVNLMMRKKVEAGSPMMGMANRRTLFEGHSMGIIRSNGNHDITIMHVAEAGFSINRKDIPKMTTEDVMAKVSEAAEDMASQLENTFLQTMNSAIQQSGNTITGNPGLSPDSILMGLEKISISFDDDDRSKPSNYTVIAGPDAIEKFKQIQDSITPVQQMELDKKYNAILDKKYEEYMLDLASRKIID